MFGKGFFRRREKEAIIEGKTPGRHDKHQKLRNAISEEFAEACLDPRELTTRLADIFLKESKQISGHVHFYFRNKSDHIILLWLEDYRHKILAKSADSEKGQHTPWMDSEFSDYRRDDVLKILRDEIDCIKIDDVLGKTWSSYEKFVSWLAKSGE